jgi:predicted dehydrogenase
MTSSKKGIGIIGCSNRTKVVLKMLLEEFWEKYHIIALYDPNEKAMKDYQRIFGKNIKKYKDFNSVVNDPEVEWVFVGSVNYAHKDQIIAAFEAGKHVFSEKPLAISLGECKSIKEKYDNVNSKLNFLISYPLRYSPHYNKMKKIIEKDMIGDIVSMEFNETIDFLHGSHFMTSWRRFNKYAGSFLIEKCCHDFDLVNWLTGSLPKRVVSFGGQGFFKPKNAHMFKKIKEKFKENPFTCKKDIIDHQVAIIEYESGTKATFHTNCSSGIPERRMYICGSKGTIRADLLTGKIEMRSFDTNKEIREIIDEENKGGHGGGDRMLVRELDKAISQNKKKKQMKDAIKSTVTAIAIDESMRTGKIIDLTKVWKSFGYRE